MPRVLLTALLILAGAAVPAARAQEPPCESQFVPPDQYGLVLVACGDAAVTGPAASAPASVYRDADPSRLREVRVTGGGGAATVYAARLDRNGIRMETTLHAEQLPAGVPLRVFMRFEFGLLEREGGADAADAKTRARRVLPPPSTPLGAEAVERVSAACFAFRRAVAPYLIGSGIGDLHRQLRVFRRARGRLAARLEAAGERRHLAPVARSLRAGNRHLLEAKRRLRRSDDPRDSAPALRAFDRTFRRELRLWRAIGLSECR